MRILVTTPYFFPHPGGSQRYIAELYQELLKISPDTLVDILTYNTEHVTEFETYQGMNVYRIPCWEILRGQFTIPHPFALFKTLRKLKKQRNAYDIVNAHTRFFDTAWWGFLVAKYFGAKSVLTDHCAAHPVHQSKIVSTISVLLDKVVIPPLTRLYDAVTVVSDATGKFLESQGGKAQYTVMYGGIFLDKKSKKKTNIKEKITIGFLGRMIPSKGPQRLLKVAQKMSEENKNLVFQFAGDGPLFDKLKKAETDNIQFLGKLNRTQVNEFLDQVDILVHPSTHHEGFPSVLLEAGAHGCAVVATPQGGTTELIIDNQTGLVSSANESALEEKVAKLLKDKELRIKLGKNLQTKVEQEFQWKDIAEKYKRFLEKLISS